MRTLLKLSMIAAFVAALALATGCEDSPLAPGADSTMTVVANPSTLVFRPADATLQATISAVVLSSTGAPEQGVTVLFSTTSGNLSSAGSGVTTNGSGTATVTLTVPRDGPAEVTVTATAAALVETVKVTKTTSSTNHPPVAKIVVSPAFEQAVNLAIVLDGTSSTDPDTGDSISSYDWTITSTDPTQPAIAKTGASVSIPGFANPQTLTIVLDVKDTSNLPATTSIAYFIKATRSCSDNTAPTAVIAGAATQTRTGAVASTVHFVLDGSLSTDTQNAIQTYTWNCGNGVAPVGTGASVTCDYVVETTNHTYTATLVVKDQGFGLPGLECQQSSAPASVQVTIGPP
jgi:hypothetical protein